MTSKHGEIESLPIRKPRKRINYVNNADFYSAIVRFQIEKKEKGSIPIPNYIGECILLIANKLSTKSRFSRYSYRDDMIADGIQDCLLYGLAAFNPTKTTNAFAYFTQIIKAAFFRRINVERKQQYIRLKSLQNLTMHEESLASMYDSNIDYINAYEEELAQKKIKSSKVIN